MMPDYMVDLYMYYFHGCRIRWIILAGLGDNDDTYLWLREFVNDA